MTEVFKSILLAKRLVDMAVYFVENSEGGIVNRERGIVSREKYNYKLLE